MIQDRQRYEEAIARIDAANAEDPNFEVVDGAKQPRELLYGRRMTAWLFRLDPDASESLRLAVRSQHIRRWSIPRSNYPMDRAGYREWRTTLARFHADTAGRILREVGYDARTVDRVGTLLRKERLKLDPEVQALEDVACLVFLQSYLAEFARGQEREKLIAIIRRTWSKMSSRGHDAALGLSFPPKVKKLLDEALNG